MATTQLFPFLHGHVVSCYRHELPQCRKNSEKRDNIGRKDEMQRPLAISWVVGYSPQWGLWRLFLLFNMARAFSPWWIPPKPLKQFRWPSMTFVHWTMPQRFVNTKGNVCLRNETAVPTLMVFRISSRSSPSQFRAELLTYHTTRCASVL